MEFISIGSQESIDCDVELVHNELQAFAQNTKNYNPYIAKCTNCHEMFKGGACFVCSLVNAALGNHYFNEDAHYFHDEESKKLKSLKARNKQSILLKSPCLNQEVSDNTVSDEHGVKGDDGDNISNKDDKGDYNGDASFEEENIIETVNYNLDEKAGSVNGDQDEVPDKKSKLAKKRGKKKGKQDYKACLNLPGILRAPCLNTIEHKDIFRRDLVNIISFWFGYIGTFQTKNIIRQVIPIGRMGISAIYECVICRKDKNSFQVLVIPICAVGDSRLLLHQSYGLVFSAKEKVLAAYIHKNFDTDVPRFSLVPSVEWITGTVLPKVKEFAEARISNQSSTSLENGEE